MKPLVLILYILLFLSCNQHSQADSNKTRQPDKIRFAKELTEHGFLKYADSVEIDNLKKQLADSFNIYEEGYFRTALIDAEELAEFSFDFFLPALNTLLSKRGIRLAARKLNNEDHSFDIVLNGDTLQLYTQQELDNNRFWDKAPRNFFRKLNEQLRSQNRDEQFYLLYGGNDLIVMLLTDKQQALIADYYKQDPNEIPYKP